MDLISPQNIYGKELSYSLMYPHSYTKHNWTASYLVIIQSPELYEWYKEDNFQDTEEWVSQTKFYETMDRAGQKLLSTDKKEDPVPETVEMLHRTQWGSLGCMPYNVVTKWDKGMRCAWQTPIARGEN